MAEGREVTGFDDKFVGILRRLLMRFCVTSVSSSEVGALLRAVTVRLEDLLNNFLGDGHFGGNLDQLTLVVVSVDDNETENSKWLKAHNRLGSYKDFGTAQTQRYLSIGIPISPSKLESLDEVKALHMISQMFSLQLETRPKRLPQGLDYIRLSEAVRTSLQVYA